MIEDLKDQICKAEIEAEENIKPLKEELTKVKSNKSAFASRNDFEFVQDCIRREDNLKFKITSQWNKYSILKDELSKLNRQKHDLEAEIKLKKDQIKRNNQILAQMNSVLENYKKSQNLKQASIDSNINPNQTEQWFEWGKNSFSETYNYFYKKIIEIDEDFKSLEAEKLKKEMNNVIKAYKKTKSLKRASEIANVNYDKVQYWYKWGSMGFGEENVYFFKNIDEA